MELTSLLIIVNVILTIVLSIKVFAGGRSKTPGEVSSDDVSRAVVDVLRGELQTHRTELRLAITEGADKSDRQLKVMSDAQATQAKDSRQELTTTRQEQQRILNDALAKLETRFGLVITSAAENHLQLQELLSTQMGLLRDDNNAKQKEQQKTLTESLTKLDTRFETLTTITAEKQLQLQELLSTQLGTLREDNNAKQKELESTISKELEKLRTENSEKLEKMRETVDEKLQGTLEKRLGESFSIVSERLELVQRGLGEMQTLASDVGGLKKVLTNVKNRGSWGEVQLSRQLEDILTPDQYAQNIPLKKGSRDVVEFAVKLPGRQDGEHVYLAIDSKFPQEDYEKLVDAQESGTAETIEAAAKNLEKAIRTQAKLISDKYIHPPETTDFAILYLPTEGLFAEVVRRPGLASDLQNSLRIMVTGPTTLMSLLNSLQMGFKTLAIEKSTSEVWRILGDAKREFGKYGGILDKLEKQLAAAQNTVATAGTRTRAISRSLKAVEATAVGVSEEQEALESLIDPDEDIDESDGDTEAN